MDIQTIMDLAVNQGLVAVAFAWLLFNNDKNNKEVLQQSYAREEKTLNVLKELSESYKELSLDVRTLKEDFEGIKKAG